MLLKALLFIAAGLAGIAALEDAGDDKTTLIIEGVGEPDQVKTDVALFVAEPAQPNDPKQPMPELPWVTPDQLPPPMGLVTRCPLGPRNLVAVPENDT